MAKSGSKKKQQSNSSKRHKRKREESTFPWERVLGICSIIVTLALVLGIFNQGGAIGAFLLGASTVSTGWIGTMFIIAMLGIAGYSFTFKGALDIDWIEATLVGTTIVSTLSFFGALPLPTKIAGAVGEGLSAAMVSLFDPILSVVILGLVSGTSSWFMLRRFGVIIPLKKLKMKINTPEKSNYNDYEDLETFSSKNELTKVIPLHNTFQETIEEEIKTQKTKKTKPMTINGLKENVKQEDLSDESLSIQTPKEVYFGKYNHPPLSLLSKSKGNPNTGNIEENARLIQKTLENFKIPVTMAEASVGPTVTRYALKPAPGVRLSKILGLQNNIELALASQIRIEAPIPGKSLVGIEIPNKSKSMIGMREILGSKEFVSSKKPLLFGVGKTVTGGTIYADLAKMPHLLVAGATGAGKSVTVHSILTALLYRNGPDMLRMILIDPKRVELTLYNKIPHLLTPVIKNAKKAILALNWAVKEMERRYDLLEKMAVRDIGSYHGNIVEPAYQQAKKEGLNLEETDELPERMPYIVIIIDEMADLMQSFPRELETSIVRLAQMSRAVGIHLILSTQRPSVNVITGLIKANVPGRLALRVASQIDSRTIIDVAGAEKLLGAGDTLFVGGTINKPTRVQCPYIPEEEVKKVVKHIRENNTHHPIDEIILPEEFEGAQESKGGDVFQEGSDGDALYSDAVKVVTQAGKGSTSFIQRKLRVGYSRAARIVDLLEENGVLGPANGSKPRQVLVSADSEIGQVADMMAMGEKTPEELKNPDMV